MFFERWVSVGGILEWLDAFTFGLNLRIHLIRDRWESANVKADNTK